MKKVIFTLAIAGMFAFGPRSRPPLKLSRPPLKASRLPLRRPNKFTPHNEKSHPVGWLFSFPDPLKPKIGNQQVTSLKTHLNHWLDAF